MFLSEVSSSFAMLKLYFIVIFTLHLLAQGEGQLCPPHQTYTECGTACPQNCSNLHSAPQLCPLVCVPGCFCNPGYVFNNNAEKICIPEHDCPGHECPPTQVFNHCGSACPITCDNYENPPPCTKQCVPRCTCPEGLVLDTETHRCVLPRHCPCSHKCPPHQTYTNCGTACPRNCSNLHSSPHICTLECVPGCFCDPGYVFNNNIERKCIPECLCLERECPPHQTYTECGTSCPLTCGNLHISEPRPCSLRCFPGCFCDPGYVFTNLLERKCIPVYQCPQIEECPPTQIFSQCATCPLTCNNFQNPPPCPRICIPGCTCLPGYVIDEETHRCVLPEECFSVADK